MTARPIDRIGRWCGDRPAATRDNAFGPETDVYRIGDKIFALVSLVDDGYVTLKADPDDGQALRQQHEYIRPGYYMNKRHWITVDVTPELSLDLVHDLVSDSYDLVRDSLPRTQRDDLISRAGARSPGRH
jgi:predicted DNA-binding protein (MmcQ/YjbR family)